MLFNISHSSCDDGLSAAAIVKMEIPDIKTIFSSYSWEWKNTEFKEGDFIYFTDFCPLPEDLHNLIKNGVDFIVLDHHKSAIERVNAYGDKAAFIDKCHFNLDICGALVTWEYFDLKFSGYTVLRKFLKYINIADLWKWDEDVRSKEICTYIRSRLKTNDIVSLNEVWRDFDEERAFEYGKIILQKVEQMVGRVVSSAALLDFDGTQIYAANDGNLASEVGHKLSEKSPSGLGLVYLFQPEKNNVLCSVRGRGAKEFAEKYGGGGHPEAAGFNMSIEQFTKYLIRGDND